MSENIPKRGRPPKLQESTAEKEPEGISKQEIPELKIGLAAFNPKTMIALQEREIKSKEATIREQIFINLSSQPRANPKDSYDQAAKAANFYAAQIRAELARQHQSNFEQP